MYRDRWTKDKVPNRQSYCRQVGIALTIFVVGTAGRHEEIITHSK